MPIAKFDGLNESHWLQVKEILVDAISIAGFEGQLVSEADESSVIHKRIIQNLYNKEIVVCDVSGRNPNVMFELGMRLAFDKPTIIIKDNETPFSFDTNNIEHLLYPRDLRYPEVVAFKKKLADKITSTCEAAMKDGYTTFLGHFGTFKVASIETEVVSSDKYILDQLENLTSKVNQILSKPTQSEDLVIKSNDMQPAGRLRTVFERTGEFPDELWKHLIVHLRYRGYRTTTLSNSSFELFHDDETIFLDNLIRRILTEYPKDITTNTQEIW